MKISKYILSLLFFLSLCQYAMASFILLPMDEQQKDHLKAYGLTYWVLDNNAEAFWLLNYKGGSFAFIHTPSFEKECLKRNISYKIISNTEFEGLKSAIGQENVNQSVIKLEVAPKIAVYTPDFNAKGEEIQPWDDAVTLVLTYAEIPYDVIYDREVLGEELLEYDWLHLHHEDFTGQYGKFYQSYHRHPWYQQNQMKMEALASDLGFQKVSQLKLAVVKKIKDFVAAGGFMFAMCSATDTYDIALSADGLDICAKIYDGDGVDPNANSELDYSPTLAFTNFNLEPNPLKYEYSDIDVTYTRRVKKDVDYFTLFDFSAKWDPIPTMLTQNHTRTVKGFMGQTTAFNKKLVKSSALILGENKGANEAKYIHNTLGEGFWTFYAGHDPEDYQHRVGDPETDLSLHPNSPGYRLILNNILFPAAEKKKRKT